LPSRVLILCLLATGPLAGQAPRPEPRHVASCRIPKALARPRALPTAFGIVEPFEYVGTYPDDCRPGWTVDLQGVTHDSASWYFAQEHALWRFPVGQDLGSPSLFLRAVADHVGFPSPLARDGYHHFGAPAYHAGAVLIPVTGRHPPLVAVFRARDLAYLGHLQLPAQHGAGWLAVSPGGQLVSSDNVITGSTGLWIYSVDWGRLLSSSLPPSPSRTSSRDRERVLLWPRANMPLLDDTGAPLRLHSMQGGVFDGRDYLFLVNGYCTGPVHNTGISVFAVRGDSAWRVAHSTRRPGPYAFEYHPGSGSMFWCRQEPEGLTLWDLDDGRAPGIRGQLHTIMVDNSPWNYGAFYFKHYRLLP